MSTLSRGNDIERDFYQLKAQEWACEPHEAEAIIVILLKLAAWHFTERRK